MRITKQVLRMGVVAAAMIVPALTVPTAAHAVEAGRAEVAWRQVQYVGGSIDNKVQLSAIDGYYVIDGEIPIVPGRGCWRAPGYDDTIVHCEATGIDQIYLDLGAGQDWLGRRHVAPTLKVPLTVLGGGDDALDGGPGINELDGGADYDVCVNGRSFQTCERF